MLGFEFVLGVAIAQRPTAAHDHCDRDPAAVLWRLWIPARVLPLWLEAVQVRPAVLHDREP